MITDNHMYRKVNMLILVETQSTPCALTTCDDCVPTAQSVLANVKAPFGTADKV